MGNQLAVQLRYAVALAGRYPLLAGADLDVRAGEILVLKGANGAGKTSLLRVVAGILPLSAGEATVLGLDPTSDSRLLRRQVGLLGHSNGLYDDLLQKRTCVLRPAPPASPRTLSQKRSSAWASGAGSFPCRREGCRLDNVVGWPWPHYWPGARNCGCWTSLMPALTLSTGNCWTDC